MDEHIIHLKKRSPEERELIAQSIFPEGFKNPGISEDTLTILWRIAQEVSKGETTYRDELGCKHCIFCDGEADPEDMFNYYHETSCITMIAGLLFAPKTNARIEHMADRRRIKISYDGGAVYGAKIVDTETGQDIPNVTKVTFNLDMKEKLPLAVIWTALPVVDVVVDAEVHTHCPLCGQEKLQTQGEQYGD